MSSLEGRIRQIGAQVDAFIAALFPEEPRAFYDIMRYHLGWLDPSLRPVATPGGKKLRPSLCVLCCEAAGGAPAAAIPAAAAVELVHNFSLIHDDIQDQSELRRHRPTVWKLWGVAQAINAGDGMFALAHQALLAAPSEIALPGLRVLERACQAICAGQFLDVALADGAMPSLAEYERMIAGKTAALLAASCELGALAAGAPAETVARYRDFGHELGLAFQIQDDLLGIWGDPATTGKPAGDDLRARKKTFPVVLAASLGGEVAEGIRRIYDGTGPLAEEAVAEAIALLERAGARAATKAAAADHLGRARGQLRAAGAASDTMALLDELCGQLLGRQR